MSVEEIEIKKVSAMKVATLQAKGLPFQEIVPKAFAELAEWMRGKGLPMPTESPMGLTIYYDDPKSVAPAEARFKVAIPVPERTELISESRAAVEILPGCEVANLTYRGPYTNLEEAYNRLFSWVYQKGYKVIDAPREVMVRWSPTMPPSEWITWIQAPIER